MLSSRSSQKFESKPAVLNFRNQSAGKELTEKVTVAQALSRELGIKLITAQIMVNRGIDSSDLAQKFLSPSLRDHLPDPAILKNGITAANLLLDAIETNKQITVYTDFDVDGLSSGAQLYLYLRMLGAKVDTFVPNRFREGYGLVLSAVDRLAVRGTQLLVTVDCGISSRAEILRAKELGLQTIIVDHHQPDELPAADVIVNPAQDGCPFQEYQLAAAGLVWMMLIILRREAAKRFPNRVIEESKAGRTWPPDPKDFLDLAALGTICDMVPLVSLNRVIASRGIDAIKRTKRPGLTALQQVSGIFGNPRLNSGHIGFMIGPRINAAGRIDDAGEVMELLTTGDSQRAEGIARNIDRLNSERQSIEEQARERSLETVLNSLELRKQPALALYDESNHAGVIGIVAQRLVERFHRPVAIMAPGELIVDGKTKPVIKGSVRSIAGFHVAEVLHELSDILISGGGHASAGGFSLEFEALPKFQAAFVAAAAERLSDKMLERRCTVDLEVALADIDHALVTEIQRLSPFGIGNPSPMFVTHKVHVEGVTLLSKGHLRLRLTDGRYYINAVAWGMQGHPLLQKDKLVSVVHQPEINTYNGVSSVQLSIKEVWES